MIFIDRLRDVNNKTNCFVELSNQARMTIDQFAGEERRKQLEKGVGTVLESAFVLDSLVLHYSLIVSLF